MIPKTKRNYSDSLSHHGVKGQQWGVRRYQKENGRLTSEGKKKEKELKNLLKEMNKETKGKGDEVSSEASDRARKEMNTKHLPALNKEYKGKYNTAMYTQAVINKYNDVLARNITEVASEYIKRTSGYSTAKKLVDENGMKEWSSVAKEVEILF